MLSMERSSEARERAHVLKYIPRQFSSTSYIHGIHTRKLLIDSYMVHTHYIVHIKVATIYMDTIIYNTYLVDEGGCFPDYTWSPV